VTFVVTLAGCLGGSPTITGRILDDRIELDASAAPGNAWLSLANQGSRPCRLILLDTLDAADAGLDPRHLLVADGRLVIRTTDPRAPGIHVSEELYAEVEGQTLPLLTDNDRPALIIPPGVTARVQLALIGTPRPGAVRIPVCDDVGDYERGRYAILTFAS
jgi:hypothetical protein